MVQPVLSQNIIQKGVTYRYNGKNPRTPIGGVYIKPISADNGVVSDDSDGSFSVALKNLTMGSRIGNVKVTKQGMMVFNQMTVDEWSVRKEPLCLILCDANEFQKQKKNLIAIGEREAKKKYDRELEKLKRENVVQQLKIDDYYNKLDSLEKEYQNALNHMDAYADVFARIDESEIDSMAQRAIELFNNGEIEKSIKMFEEGNYLKKLDDALRVKFQTKSMRQLADSIEFLADRDIGKYTENIKAQVAAYKLSKNYHKVKICLKTLADKLQTTDAIGQYMIFCKEQNDYRDEEECLRKLENVVTRTHSTDKEMLFFGIYSDFASLYLRTNRLVESENMFKSALGIYRNLSTEKQKIYSSLLAKTYTSLALLYNMSGKFAECDATYKLLLPIYERLIKEDPKEYESDMAFLYSTIGYFYNRISRFDESEEMYRLSLNIYDRLVHENPIKYEPGLYAAYLGFGVLYDNMHLFSKSKEMYEHSWDIIKHLAKENPNAHEPNLAVLYNNWGGLYYKTQQFKESEEMYKKALVIYESMAKVNPKVYNPNLAMTYGNLGSLYNDTQQFRESEEMYKKALVIYESMAKVNPKVYNPNLAMTYDNLGSLYDDTQLFRESEEMHKKALTIFEYLAKKSSNVYEPHLAMSYNNLGHLYKNTQQFKESEEMYKKALVIRKRLSRENPKVYEPDLASSYSNLALLYSIAQRFDESEAMYNASTKIYTRLYEKNPPLYQKKLADDYYFLGCSMVDRKKYHEAVDVFEKSLELQEDVIKTDNDSLLWRSCLSFLVDLYVNEKDYKLAMTYNKRLLPVLKTKFLKNTKKYNKTYSGKLINQSYCSNCLGLFAKGEQISLSALQSDSSNHIAYTNLAAALLFQKKTDEAEKIYSQHKLELKDVFLDDFAEYERLKIIPKECEADVERIKKMLLEQ